MSEKNSQDGGAQPTEEIIDKSAAPAVEEINEQDDLSEFGVPAMPTEEEEESEEEEVEDKPEAAAAPEKVVETPEEEIELPAIPAPESRPTRLDTRVAKLYIRNLILLGEENIPTEEQVIADLRNVSKEDKIQAMHYHRLEGKKLSGDTSGDELGEEDIEAIKDAERESIRQEILIEENEKQVKRKFINFVESHPELVAENKEYDPRLAKAVETLWRKGMDIEEAYETVTEATSSVKEDAGKVAAKTKQKLLSGSVSATNDFSKGEKKMTWTEFDKLRISDPERYEKLLDEGYQPSDE